MKAINSSRDVVVALKVQHAVSLWARSRGLLGRKTLEPGEGLLIDPCSGIHTWGMAFPIDAAFLSRDGSIVQIARKIGPWRMSRYVFKARTVLELPAGTLEETGTRVGDKLVFEA